MSTPTLKLIMATSQDDIVSLGPDDDMTWTGPDDKRAFRLLTSVGGVLGAGRRTFERLPVLKGRTVRCISNRKGWIYNAEARKVLEAGPGEGVVDDSVGYVRTLGLGRFAHEHPHGWLIGGQTVALEAFSSRLLGQVYLCRSPVELKQVADPRTAQVNCITHQLKRRPWELQDVVRVGDTVVEVWRNRE